MHNKNRSSHLDSETARDTGKGSHPTQSGLKDTKNLESFWPCFHYSKIFNFFQSTYIQDLQILANQKFILYHKLTVNSALVCFPLFFLFLFAGMWSSMVYKFKETKSLGVLFWVFGLVFFSVERGQNNKLLCLWISHRSNFNLKGKMKKAWEEEPVEK